MYTSTYIYMYIDGIFYAYVLFVSNGFASERKSIFRIFLDNLIMLDMVFASSAKIVGRRRTNIIFNL